MNDILQRVTMTFQVVVNFNQFWFHNYKFQIISSLRFFFVKQIMGETLTLDESISFDLLKSNHMGE
jgi:hypothetical protein